MTKDEADESQNSQISQKWEKRTGIQSGNGLLKVFGWTLGEDGRFCCHVYVAYAFEDLPPLRV